MDFSIIIPTYNRNDLLSNCLDLIGKAIEKDKTSSYEVIICDDSADNNAKLLIEKTYPWATWIAGPKRGPAANRNSGAKYAKAKWLVFLDDDCLPSENLLSEYQNAIIQNSSTKIFEGCIKADRNKKSFLEEAPINETGGALWSCNFCIQKQFFLEILHGFDENFPFAAMEDVDMHYRIEKLQEPILFVADAIVVHPWRQQKNLLKLTKKRFDSWRYFMDKHPEKFKHNDLFSLRAFAGFAYRELFLNGLKYRGRGLYLYFVNYLKRTYFQLKYSNERK